MEEKGDYVHGMEEKGEYVHGMEEKGDYVHGMEEKGEYVHGMEEKGNYVHGMEEKGEYVHGMEEKGEYVHNYAHTYASHSAGALLSVWHGRRGGQSWLECASAVFDTQDWCAKGCKSLDCLDDRERGWGVARLTIEHRASTRRMARGFGLKSHIWGRGPGCRVKKDREGLEGCLLWNASPSFCLGRRAPWPTPLYGRSSSQRSVR